MGYPFPRPRLPLIPKPKRPLERKPMTVAVGFKCNDGVVLATDSQHTIVGYSKEYKGKISTSIFQNLTIAIAGAGEDDYIESAREYALDGIRECKNIAEIRDHLRQKLLCFFDEHLARWSIFQEHERPIVDLLIGCSVKDGTTDLYHYRGTAFHHVQHLAIGSGVVLANSLISTYCWDVVTLEDAVPSAIFVVSKVKDTVDGCGGFTGVVVLGEGGDYGLMDTAKVEDIEAELTKAQSITTKDLIARIRIGGPKQIDWIRRNKVTETGWGQ